MVSVHSCVRGRILVHLFEGGWFRDIHVWGVGFRCISLRSEISVHSCVRGKIPVHLLEGWWFRCIHVWGVRFRCIGAFTWGVMISVESCVRGKTSVHLLEEWRFRCIHVWGVGLPWIYLRRDDVGAFMCEGWDSAACTWGMMISVHQCVRRRIPVHLPQEWWFRCIHVWVVGFRCIYLRGDDFGAFCVRGKILVHLLEGWWFRYLHV